MTVRLGKSTSSEEIRQALSQFGRFSKIEIDKETDKESKTEFYVFREIGFFKGLHRLIFESKENLEYKRAQTRKFLYELSKDRKYIQKSLGTSIFYKKSWTVGEFIDKLKIKTDFIRREKNEDLLRIPQSLTSKVGVIDAEISHIQANTVVTWVMGEIEDKLMKKFNADLMADNKKSDLKTIDEVKIIPMPHKYDPTPSDVRAAYENALKAAHGQVVISPIVDIPVHEIQTRQPEYSRAGIVDRMYSDESIKILLQEIDKAVESNPSIQSVTIARGDVPDERFLSRVLAQREILDAAKTKNDANEISTTKLAAMPAGLKLIVDDVGDENCLIVKSGSEVSQLDETGLSQVRLYRGDPGTVTAETAFLTFGSIMRCASTLASSGMKQFQRVCNLTFDPASVITEEVNKIRRTTERNFRVSSVELPPCEMPSDRLYAIDEKVPNLMEVDSAKNFFTEHLTGLSGKVVIEITGNKILDQALWEALEELNSKFEEQNLVCILASPDDAIRARFLDEIVEPPLDIDGDEDKPFDFFSQLKHKYRR
jgi:hypothetical protein